MRSTTRETLKSVIDKLEIVKESRQFEEHESDTAFDSALSELKQHFESWKNYHQISSLHKDDMLNLGFMVDDVDDSTMDTIASKLGNDYTEQLFWGSLGIIAEYCGVKKGIKTVEQALKYCKSQGVAFIPSDGVHKWVFEDLTDPEEIAQFKTDEEFIEYLNNFIKQN